MGVTHRQSMRVTVKTSKHVIISEVSQTLPSFKPLVMHGQQVRLPVRREEDVRFLTVERIVVFLWHPSRHGGLCPESTTNGVGSWS